MGSRGGNWETLLLFGSFRSLEIFAVMFGDEATQPAWREESRL